MIPVKTTNPDNLYRCRGSSFTYLYSTITKLEVRPSG